MRTRPEGFPLAKDAISRLVKPGGYVVSYGWNTVGMGHARWFSPVEYLICSHGGNRNDTLVTVELKLPSLFDSLSDAVDPVEGIVEG